jgi:hypothetical protein
MLAEAVLVAHFAIVLFITAGLPLIYLGAARRWAWVRQWQWRILHLGATAFVAAESLVGVDCPLTVWEDVLRGDRPRMGFIERWIERVMFFDAPRWVFTLLYTVFALLVLVTWFAAPTAARRCNGGERAGMRPP